MTSEYRRIRVVLPAAVAGSDSVRVGNDMRVEDVETGDLLGGVTKVEIVSEVDHFVTVVVTFIDAEIVVR